MTTRTFLMNWAMRLLCLAACAGLGPVVQASPAFGFHDATDGVSCHHFDAGLGMAWPNGAAQWVDAKGLQGGAVPFDNQPVDMRGGLAALRWNVSALVKQWASGKVPVEGLMVMGPGGAQFHSRESAEVDKRPTLRLNYAGGASDLLSPVADAVLDCSTYSGVGRCRWRADLRRDGGTHRRRTACAAADRHHPADEDAHAPGRAGRGHGPDLPGRARYRR